VAAAEGRTQQFRGEMRENSGLEAHRLAASFDLSTRLRANPSRPSRLRANPSRPSRQFFPRGALAASFFPSLLAGGAFPHGYARASRDYEPVRDYALD